MNTLEKNKQIVKNKKLDEIQDRYYDRLYGISVMFSLFFYMNRNISKKNYDNEEIKISNDFDDSYTTIITTENIIKSRNSGELYKIIHYQSYVAIISSFEILIDDLFSLYKIPESKVKNFISPFYEKNKKNMNNCINNTIIKKLIIIHEFLNIKSVILHEKELNIYYALIKVRNIIVHCNGNVNTPLNIIYYNELIVNKEVVFGANKFDEILHRFMIPLKSLFFYLDASLQHTIKPQESTRKMKNNLDF